MSFRDNGEADDANALMFYSMGRITGGGEMGGRGFAKGRWIRVSVCNSSTFGKGCPTLSASSDQHLQRGLATRIGANRANVHEIAAGEMCRRGNTLKTAASSAAVFDIMKLFFWDARKRIPKEQDITLQSNRLPKPGKFLKSTILMQR